MEAPVRVAEHDLAEQVGVALEPAEEPTVCGLCGAPLHGRGVVFKGIRFGAYPGRLEPLVQDVYACPACVASRQASIACEKVG